MSETMRRTLVLGGGALNGGSWAVGVLAGLADAGVELRDADLVVGTSAGAVIGTQLRAGVALDELYARQSAPAPPELTVRIPLPLTLRILWAMLPTRDAATAARRVGRLALRPGAAPETAALRAVGALLGDGIREWPEHPLRLAAVDAHSGALECLHAGSGFGLLESVAASCTLPGVWSPATLGGRRWIDGGIHSTTNAHLAHGSERVVVIAPIPRAPGPGSSPAGQVAGLERSGARVALVVPGAHARAAYGRDLLDPALRAAAARAGRAEAAAHAARVAEVWDG